MKKRNKERAHLLMDLSLCANPEVLRSLKHQAGYPWIPRFGLGPWIGARVASQHCPVLRPGQRIVIIGNDPMENVY
jgi:hypothetical protein